jgi:DNA primase
MDLEEILNNLGYELTDKGRDFRTKPLYRDSSNATSLSIDKKTGNWIDFSAGKKGNLIELVQLTLNLKNVDEAKNILTSKFAFIPKKFEYKEEIKMQKTYPKDSLSFMIKDHSYWLNRGISQNTLDLFQGGVFESGKFKNRYVFPIFNAKGELVGGSGRDLSGQSLVKWKHLGEKSSWLYPLFINREIIKEKKEVILVESIGDCLSLWEAGFRNTMVIFGLFLSPEVLKALLGLDPDRIIISLNDDSAKNDAGNKAVKEIKKVLMRHFDSSQIIVNFPLRKDFNEMLLEDPALFEEWKKNLVPFLESPETKFNENSTGEEIPVSESD